MMLFNSLLLAWYEYFCICRWNICMPWSTKYWTYWQVKSELLLALMQGIQLIFLRLKKPRKIHASTGAHLLKKILFIFSHRYNKWWLCLRKISLWQWWVSLLYNCNIDILVNIGSGNDLVVHRRQAIIWKKYWLTGIVDWTLRKNFCEIWIKMLIFPWAKCFV